MVGSDSLHWLESVGGGGGGGGGGATGGGGLIRKRDVRSSVCLSACVCSFDKSRQMVG